MLYEGFAKKIFKRVRILLLSIQEKDDFIQTPVIINKVGKVD